MTDENFMEKALNLAQLAKKLGEVPVGALVVIDGLVVTEAFNQRELKHSSLEHAELSAIRQACTKLGRWRLSDATFVKNLKPERAMKSKNKSVSKNPAKMA